MRLADERHHMMLAVGGERNVADKDDIVVAVDVLERPVERLGGVEGVAGIKLLIGGDNATRRVEETVAIGIVSRPGDQRPYGRLGFLAARALPLRNLQLRCDFRGFLRESVHKTLRFPEPNVVVPAFFPARSWPI
jgi:hypothetical protein